MRLLDRAPKSAILREPYTPEEIDEHEHSGRIWATIMECRREAQELVRAAYDRGYWDGKTDRSKDTGVGD
jgi:hypothetical protein